MSKTRKRAVNTFHHALMARFPCAFPPDYDDLRPLKHGIDADIRARWPEVDPNLLRQALANHTGRDGYLLALIHRRGDHRYDLDGNAVGTVTPAERAEAERRLADSVQRHQARDARIRTHQEREAKRKAQRELERRNREARAARRAEHERRQQEAAARKAALAAQGITVESRAERKRRLIREAAERAASRFSGSRPSGERTILPSSPQSTTLKPRSPARPDAASDKPLPSVEYRKKRTVVPPDKEKPS